MGRSGVPLWLATAGCVLLLGCRGSQARDPGFDPNDPLDVARAYVEMNLTCRNPGYAFVYDPMNPVRSLGGNVCCTGNAITAGSFDQRKTEERPDVLVYTTEAFKEGIELSGPIVPTLYVSSDAKDTDVTVKVSGPVNVTGELKG